MLKIPIAFWHNAYCPMSYEVQGLGGWLGAPEVVGGEREDLGGLSADSKLGKVRSGQVS